ncbi:5-dehydro-2-deoxygluconokinase [Virgibacillus subterraneus]|uniref:5-dehydro-2-deoxygluconokinase n=1 Tax=Virgibacillus subterraneus TaxID=621109 RepID=A0A1H9AWW4_9BACI|nr:sugar kinase [Virgibacillus subterraneus]SEP81292.1 5-dehydro-2-deoxygluconokinase [Virgibacillus subterraneus]
MEKSLDVVTFGETMVLFEPVQMFPLEYVGQFHKHIGGAESNVSIGLTRLGHKVGWFSKLGNDPFGRYILQFIRGEGIDTSACLQTDEAPTGLLFKEKKSHENLNVFYYRKHSAASLMTPQDLDKSYIANAKFLHVTGITPALSETCEQTVFQVMDIAKKNNTTIVFDPNLRLKLWKAEKARAVLLKMAEQADVILPGLDEGTFLTGETGPEAIAAALNKDGKKAIVVKLGSEGAYYQKGEASGFVRGYPVAQVIDPVGAGDGFAAGIISGMLRNDSLPDTLARANAIGAITVGMHGDVEGLPREDELERFLDNGSNNSDVNR